MAEDIAAPSDKQTTGEIDPSTWDEEKAVTDRPNDLVDGTVTNSTLADRAKARAKVIEKAEVEDKAVTRAKRK